MIRMGKATDAVTQSADAVKDLANSAREELSGLSSQLRTGAQLGPILVVGAAIVSVVALVIALIAVSRHD